ncbi:MAG TPA: hypothetical protein VK426_08410 [Methanobacterium sp.]|nr:hypothetical protein [Methanobacterium sp.]
MTNLIVNVIYVLIMVALIVFLDLKYFRDDFLKRLIVNVLVVLVALTFYYLFLVNL